MSPRRQTDFPNRLLSMVAVFVVLVPLYTTGCSCRKPLIAWHLNHTVGMLPEPRRGKTQSLQPLWLLLSVVPFIIPYYTYSGCISKKGQGMLLALTELSAILGHRASVSTEKLGWARCQASRWEIQHNICEQLTATLTHSLLFSFVSLASHTQQAFLSVVSH